MRSGEPSDDRDEHSGVDHGDDSDVGLLSPGWAGSRVATATGDPAVLAAIVLFEEALAEVIAPVGVAERIAAASSGLMPRDIAVAARVSGNPVIPVLDAMRARLAGDRDALHWLHRGATSQDALDTALALIASQAVAVIIEDARASVEALTGHAEAHRGTVMPGRTLTQVSTPITLGLKLSGWAWSIARATAALSRARDSLPLQLGGASGTLASFVAMHQAGAASPQAVVDALAAELGLRAPVAPWHVLRSPITRLADALTELSDAWGVVGSNVALLARTEIGELDDGAEGKSSAMPHKSNPTRAVLLNASARQAPLLAAQLHLDAATTVDERPDGAWHAEWQSLRSLLRTVGGATEVGRELTEGLRVHEARIAANLAATSADLVSESMKYTDAAVAPAGYTGDAAALTDRLIAAAREELS